MRPKIFRWISCATIPVAFWGLCACTGASGRNKPTLVFSASMGAISAGQSVTLSWQAADATSVTITAAAGTSSRTLTSSSQLVGSVTDSPTQTTTYTAVANGPNGSSAPQTATVQVAQNVQPQVTQFTANPMFVNAGQTTTLTWATTNATSVTIIPAFPVPEDSGPLPVSGSSLVPANSTTTYSITASGPGGTSAASTVTVTVPFTLSLTATPSTIAAGQSSTLAWEVT